MLDLFSRLHRVVVLESSFRILNRLITNREEVAAPIYGLRTPASFFPSKHETREIFIKQFNALCIIHSDLILIDKLLSCYVSETDLSGAACIIQVRFLIVIRDLEFEGE